MILWCIPRSCVKIWLSVIKGLDGTKSNIGALQGITCWFWLYVYPSLTLIGCYACENCWKEPFCWGIDIYRGWSKTICYNGWDLDRFIAKNVNGEKYDTCWVSPIIPWHSFSYFHFLIFYKMVLGESSCSWCSNSTKVCGTKYCLRSWYSKSKW